MRFAQSARVVLLRPIRQGNALIEPAGAGGVVQRDTGAITIVRFENGQTLPVSSDKLVNDHSNDPRSSPEGGAT